MVVIDHYLRISVDFVHTIDLCSCFRRRELRPASLKRLLSSCSFWVVQGQQTARIDDRNHVSGGNYYSNSMEVFEYTWRTQGEMLRLGVFD